jgi:multiple antibiotic resistance protein
MIESFITAFIIYFVVIDPVGNAPVFLAVTTAQTRRQKFRTAIEATLFASFIMLFFALCGAWVLAYLKITQPAFKIAGGIILFLVSLDMLSARRQQRKRDESTDNEGDNLAIYPLAILMLAGPAAIISVIVVTAEFSDALGRSLIGYSALLACFSNLSLVYLPWRMLACEIRFRPSEVFAPVLAPPCSLQRPFFLFAGRW